jgi:predicted PhzF superfamily epimerase YddE/YHI9
VSIVDACLREDEGGSPTAVLDDLPLSESGRRQVPIQAGTSHAVFISPAANAVSLRFWTAAGELPACGHGTVAALAVLAERSGQVEYRSEVHLTGQVVQGWAARHEGHTEAAFTTASIALREPTVQ